MSNPLIRIHNTEIDEVIDREMTAEELKIMIERQAFIDAEKAKAEAKAQAKAALLERLGITQDEANLLLS